MLGFMLAPSRSEVLQPTLHYLLALLEFSQYLDIDTARAYALHMLPAHPEFMASPALQLACAHKYNVREWVALPFRALLRAPMDSITLDQAMDMGMEWYHLLNKTASEIDVFLRYTAYNAPEVPNSWRCLYPYDQCRKAWEMGWWICYAKPLLHPDQAASCEAAIEEVENGHIRGMCIDCKRRTVQATKDAEMSGEVEAKIVKAITILENLVMDIYKGAAGRESRL